MRPLALRIERFATSKLSAGSSFRFAGVLRFIGKDAFALLALNGLGSLFLALSEIAVAAFIQLFLVALGLIPPELNNLFGNTTVATWQACIFLALIGFVRSAGQFLTSQSSGDAQAVLQDRMRTTLLAQVIHSNTPPSHSHVLNLTSEIFPKSANFAFSSAQFLATSSQMLVLLLVMMFVAWKEASVALLGFLILGIWVLKLNRKTLTNASKLPSMHEDVLRTMNRVNANWLLLYLLGTQSEEFKRSVADIRSYTSQAKKTHRLGVLTGSFPPFVGILILIGVILLSQTYFTTSSSKLLIFLYLFIRFIQNLAGGLSYLGQCQGSYPHFKAAYQFFLAAEPKLRNAIATHSQNSPEAEPKSGQPAVEISVQDMSYRYTASSAFIFNQFSMSLAAGEQVGIVGRSGVGKSTLLSLILGIYPPECGTIKINGTEASEALRQRQYTLGYVGPEPFLFAGNMKENLLYGNRSKLSDNDLINTLHSLDLFKNQPDPLGVLLESGGTNFSTGQRQRICIARALLNKPQFLVLDEVSANLDTETEASLAETLKSLKGSCTILIVTHRSGILKYSDRVVKLG